MAVHITKKAEVPQSTAPNSGPGVKKTRTKQPTKAGTQPKSAKTPQSLEQSLSKYHDHTDKELEKFIEPKPERAQNLSHRLDLEQQEARIVLMHRMLIRKVSPEEIRKILNIGVAMYYRIKNLLDARMRLDVSKVDVPYLIGDSLAFYDEVRSMALTMSSSSGITDPRVKVGAMSLALKAESDKNAFLASCGVYSAPVVEHIVRGMVSTGNFNMVDGASARVVEAEEITFDMALRLKQFARLRALES